MRDFFFISGIVDVAIGLSGFITLNLVRINFPRVSIGYGFLVTAICGLILIILNFK